ncbi:hypothetical protein HYPSUDRAFT_36063 [Hypholoma sublateritium FD-334 SS-4]|uniref:Required for respiratory growth protein 7, mitochondrial n=1 Tax=Hypholoma sublateritium (strain FD-334 SS-4) TaxID=945553 RepID=A0A0D2Q5P1_HYPSF|nr:hypothetical protein HYPSUDRAFT_36063 [Hypholoma sublateritium FD-334 SS-4]
MFLRARTSHMHPKTILRRIPPTRSLCTVDLRSSKTSTVERGNAFEERSLQLLEQTMSMSLRRVGGKEDGGIDLLGWWWLPHDVFAGQSTETPLENRRRIRVVGQCKAEKKKMGPNYVRELEGVVFRLLATSSDDTMTPPLQSQISTSPVVALLISQSAFTKSTLIRAHSSPIPFCLLHLPPVQDALHSNVPDVHVAESVPVPVGHLGSALCNPALNGIQGLLKGQMEVRWERHHMGYSGRPALWWNAEKLHSRISRTDLDMSE